MQGRMGHIMIISFTVYYLVLEIEMIHSGMKFSFKLCQHVWFEPAHIRINGLISKHKN